MRAPLQIIGLLGSAILALAAPEPGTRETDATEAVATMDRLSASIEQARGKLEAAGLEDAFKTPIANRLDEAEKNAESAQTSWRRAQELEQGAPELPKRIEELEAELDAMPAADAEGAKVPSDVAELQTAVERKRGEVAVMETELTTRQRELAKLKARPIEVGTRLPMAYTELSDASARLETLGGTADPSIGREVDRLWFESRREALRAEVAMLEQEQVGQLLRERRSDLERQLVAGRLRYETAALQRLEQAFQDRLETEVSQLMREVDGVMEGLPVTATELAGIASDLRDMLAELNAQAARAKKVATEAAKTREKLADLRRDQELLRRQIEFGGLEGVIMQAMLDLRKKIPDPRALDFRLLRLEEEISAARFTRSRFDDLKEQQVELEQRWADDPAAKPVLDLRKRLLDRLDSSQGALIRDLAQWGADAKVYRNLAGELTEMLADQLFWNRSSKPAGMEFLRRLPESAGTLAAPDRWWGLAMTIARIPARHPMGAAVLGLALIAWIAARRYLRASITRSGTRIRRISSDRLGHTVRALVQAQLLVLPLPLVLGFTSWALSREPDAQPWVRGASLWMGWAAMTLYWILSLRELARPGGIGQVHFGWKGEASMALSRGLARVAFIYLPAMVPVCITLFDEQAHAFDSIGRLGFMLGMVGLAWVLAGMLDPGTGVFARIVRERPDMLFVKTRKLWFWGLVGTPLALTCLALAGYTVTALMLAGQFFVALRWLSLGFVVYGVGLRGFMIKRRRLALAEAMAARQARQAASAGNSTEETPSDGPVVIDEDSVQLGLEDVERQTRRLLRSLVGIAVVVAISYSVAASLPLERIAELRLIGDLAWLDALKGLLVAAVSWTVIRNLPGMLDMAGLRETGMESGTRYAVATLSQYALGAIGILLVANSMMLDWSRFGWIAAALGVGLGFGLQEIVANFVCGIILLFERPIRVGDVVTVGEVTGTVARIQMRATTITNWDRQEFVVPNKNFITGSIINWTLSSPLNRITIPVGVAYGTDTGEARRILAEIAADHPRVLRDPAPLISFESFAESTLDLFLRCYLPDLDNRLLTITELHEEIDRRFKQAGIEIAFPQRDLHLRGIPEEFIRRARDGEEIPDVMPRTE